MVGKSLVIKSGTSIACPDVEMTGLGDAEMSEVSGLGKIRNIGIIAHIDAGKTTVTERILYYTGRTYKVGGVDEGTAVMDWMEQERQRGITITSAATTCSWLDHGINIIDTPGHVDFTAEVERSLRVLDGGIVVLDAVAGVLKELLGAKAVPIQLPVGEEKSFQGVIDLIENKGWIFSGDVDAEPEAIGIPQDYGEKVREQREILLESLAEEDDEFMAAYLEGRAVTPSEIRAALRRACTANKIVPVLCGSALKNKGVQPLLDAVVNYLPSPLDVPPVQGMDGRTGQVVTRSASVADPFSALAFKVVTDPFVGRLVYFRVYSGKVKAKAQVFNSARERKERLGRLLRMHANRREEVEEVSAGGIAAALGLRSTFTGDTLCDPSKLILLESIGFPRPVISVAIEPKTKADQDKIWDALGKLTEEDPTFEAHHEEDTGQTLISGMGELHLEVLLERLRREFNVEARTGKPQVAYKETITQVAKGEGKFIKQTGGHGQYGHVLIRVEPGERDSGFVFVDETRGGTIPKEFIRSVQAGVKEAVERGVLAGYSMVDIRVILYDGSYHEVDSSDMAFKVAGSIALRDAANRAKLTLLEPIMKLDIYTPEPFLGDILGDLDARRGQIEGIGVQGDIRVVQAMIPLGESFGYATVLRSLSQGRATHSMEFRHYMELPPGMVEQIIKSTGRVV